MTERHTCNWAGCEAVFIGSEPPARIWVMTSADDDDWFLCGAHVDALDRLLKD